MKATKLIYPLAFALAVTLASTGCKHKPTGLTPLLGLNPPPPGFSGNPSTMNGGLPPGSTINPTQPAGSEQGGGKLAGLQLFEGMLMDTNTLAAYTIHFAYDSSVIRDSDQANLQSVAQVLSANQNDKLLIQGNCDERGTEEYNRALGERRALAARQALAQLNVDPMRIRVESFGKDNPVDPGHDESAWRANRRDDFVLLLPNPGNGGM